MFYKAISVALAAGMGWYAYQTGFDYEQCVFVLIMPMATLASFLVLASGD